MKINNRFIVGVIFTSFVSIANAKIKCTQGQHECGCGMCCSTAALTSTSTRPECLDGCPNVNCLVYQPVCCPDVVKRCPKGQHECGCGMCCSTATSTCTSKSTRTECLNDCPNVNCLVYQPVCCPDVVKRCPKGQHECGCGMCCSTTTLTSTSTRPECLDGCPNVNCLVYQPVCCPDVANRCPNMS